MVAACACEALDSMTAAMVSDRTERLNGRQKVRIFLRRHAKDEPVVVLLNWLTFTSVRLESSAKASGRKPSVNCAAAPGDFGGDPFAEFLARGASEFRAAVEEIAQIEIDPARHRPAIRAAQFLHDSVIAGRPSPQPGNTGP